MAFDALRLEFGLNGGASKPHWHPALKALRGALREIANKKHLVRAMTDPEYRGWKRPKGRKERAIAAAKMRDYVDFQKALRVRF